MEEKVNKRKIIFVINMILFAVFIAFSFTEACRLITFSGRNFPISFYISIIALPYFYITYFIFYKDRHINRVIIIVLAIFILLAIPSFGVALFLYPSYSGLFNTNPLIVWLEVCAKYLYDLAIIPFLFFFMQRLCLKKLKLFIYIYLWVVYFVVFLQLLIHLTDSSLIKNIYTSLDFLKILETPELIAKVKINYSEFRAYGLSGEPGHNAIFLTCLVIPFLLYNFKNFFSMKIWFRIFHFITFVLAVIFAYLTKSSAVYIGLIIDLIFAIYMFIESKNIKKRIKIILLISLGISIIAVLTIPPANTTIFKYISKSIDLNNLSTSHHYASVYNELVIFIQNPLIGIGDGMQGYFYFDNLINTHFAYIGIETLTMMKGNRGLVEGGSAIPTILSSFGIHGVIVIIVSFFAYRKDYKSIIEHKSLTIERTALIFSVISLLIICFARSQIHRNYPIFIVFGLPELLINKFKKEDRIYIEKQYYLIEYPLLQVNI